MKLLSIVLTGRNDDYAGNFAERTFAAQARNQAEATRFGIAADWVFVEWNPTNTDYLSYRLAAQFGFRCFVVSPEIHAKLIAPGLTFSQSFAKNVGMRRVRGDWTLVTNADVIFDEHMWQNIGRGLDPAFMYRAERCDVDWKFFDKPFDVIRANIIRRHDSKGGRHFTQAAGDFTLFATSKRFGYDESINFTDVHTDGRFCTNWSATYNNGNPRAWRSFKFIGSVYKADHPLTYANTQNTRDANRKGSTQWKSQARSCEGPALYVNRPKWGCADAKVTPIAGGVWLLE